MKPNQAPCIQTYNRPRQRVDLKKIAVQRLGGYFCEGFQRSGSRSLYFSSGVFGGQFYSAILRCCNGDKLYNTAYGFKWAYEGTELNEEWVKNTTNVTSKRVEQIDPKNGEVLKVWNMIKEVSQYYNVSESCICECCNGRQKTSAGFIWRYEDENLRVEYISKPSRKKPVLQFDMSGQFIKEWRSAKEAALAMGCSPSAIVQCCRGGHKTVRGFVWKYKCKRI